MSGCSHTLLRPRSLITLFLVLTTPSLSQSQISQASLPPCPVANLSFGACSNPSITFITSSDFAIQAFAPSNQDEFEHGTAATIDIVEQYICNRLQSVCEADNATVAQCAAALEVYGGLSMQGALAVSQWNAALGLTEPAGSGGTCLLLVGQSLKTVTATVTVSTTSGQKLPAQSTVASNSTNQGNSNSRFSQTVIASLSTGSSNSGSLQTVTRTLTVAVPAAANTDTVSPPGAAAVPQAAEDPQSVAAPVVATETQSSATAAPAAPPAPTAASTQNNPAATQPPPALTNSAPPASTPTTLTTRSTSSTSASTANPATALSPVSADASSTVPPTDAAAAAPSSSDSNSNSGPDTNTNVGGSNGDKGQGSVQQHIGADSDGGGSPFQFSGSRRGNMPSSINAAPGWAVVWLAMALLG